MFWALDKWRWQGKGRTFEPTGLLENCSSSCKRIALMVFRKQKWRNVLHQFLVPFCETLSQKEIGNFWDKDFDLEENFVRCFSIWRLAFSHTSLSLNCRWTLHQFSPDINGRKQLYLGVICLGFISISRLTCNKDFSKYLGS